MTLKRKFLLQNLLLVLALLSAGTVAVWRLRAVGPILVVRERGGGHHAMVVSGVSTGGSAPMVLVQDPWPSELLATGEWTEGGPGREITFPSFQNMLAPQLRAYNMLKLANPGRLHLRLTPGTT